MSEDTSKHEREVYNMSCDCCKVRMENENRLLRSREALISRLLGTAIGMAVGFIVLILFLSKCSS